MLFVPIRRLMERLSVPFAPIRRNVRRKEQGAGLSPRSALPPGGSGFLGSDGVRLQLLLRRGSWGGGGVCNRTRCLPGSDTDPGRVSQTGLVPLQVKAQLGTEASFVTEP